MFKRFITIFLLLVFSLILISCGAKPSGVYYSGDIESKNYMRCEFNGNKISIDIYSNGVKIDNLSISGKYDINGDQITIFHKNENGEEQSTTKYFEFFDDDSLKIDAFIFERDE